MTLDPTRIPVHIAFVMDGNGRWAQLRGAKRTDGHTAGEEAMYRTVLAAEELGVRWLTFYAFSTENWKRPLSEVRFLMQLHERMLERRLPELHERNVRMRFLGRRDRRVPPRLAREMDRAMAKTANNTGTTLSIAFNYGGRAELVDALRRMAADGITGRDVNEDTLRRYLYAPDMPDPDLVVRTSGEYRISNFLLWEVAYSELLFTDVLWPDFGPEQLEAAIAEYQSRTRRFGRVAAAEPALLSPTPAAVGG